MHAATPSQPIAASTTPSFWSLLAPIISVVFVGFLIVGLALPVLPLHVHQGLGLSTFIVGLVAGSQFIASLLSRVWAGHFSDGRGAKPTVIVGLLGAAASGGLYLVSLTLTQAPMLSVAVLLLGRALLGAAESFIITGALSWGLAIVPSSMTGKVIAWVGSAMFGAFAVGAPMGTALFAAEGFVAVAAATLLVPLVTLALILPRKAPAPSVTEEHPPVSQVLRSVWVPGLALAASSVGFGSITAFVTLLYSAQGWGAGWQAFTAFAIALILARAVGGHLPDKLGGARVAMFSIVIEAIGQGLLWWAPSSSVALAGAALTGLGYSLVYPGLGIEAVRRAPAKSKGLAMGAFTACLDLALGVASPGLGLIAGHAGLRAVFLVGAVVALAGAAIAAGLMAGSSSPHPGDAAGA